MTQRPYLDSSALVKLVITEPETDALRSYLAGRDPAAIRVATFEVHRAVARVRKMDGEAEAMLEALWRRSLLIELDAPLAASAGRLEPSLLRSLDAIHLASAMAIRDAVGDFVTYDARLADAARSLGFTVAAPA